MFGVDIIGYLYLKIKDDMGLEYENYKISLNIADDTCV